MFEAQRERKFLWVREALVIAGLLLFVLLPFAGTIVHGVPISKLGMLKTMDAVQDPTLCAPWCILDDLSSSMAHIPNEIFIKHNAGSQMPLWNPLNGAGRPFVGEFQTLQFSFFHLLFPATSPYLYNLGIVFKIFLSGTGAYLLGRRMNLSAWSAAAVGAAYALCPHCLRFTELVDNYCFYPWLSFVFLWFANRPSLLRAITAGLLTAACAYNMHPETFACAAALAATFALIGLLNKKERFGKSLRWITLIAAISFGAAAPLVLPLVEFIANGSSYKFAAHQIEHIQFTDFLFSLFLPLGPGSTYIGPVLGLVLPLGLVLWAKQQRLLFSALISVILFSTRPGILEGIFSNGWMCFLLPEYVLYAAILLVLLCAGSGLDEVLKRREQTRKASLLLICSTSAIGLFLLSTQIPRYAAFLSRICDLVIDAGISMPLLLLSFCLLIGVTILALMPASKKILFVPILATLVAGNSLILALLVPRELGGQVPFNYQHNSVTMKLQSLNGRMMATGYNLFQPNTNLIYGIDDFRSTAPLYPRRYTDFLKLGGGGGKFCTIPEAPWKLNHIFDLAGVKYVLSDRAIESVDPSIQSAAEETARQNEGSNALKLADGVRFDDGQGRYEPNSRAVFANATLTVHSNAEGHYSCALALSDAQGNILTPLRWLNDRIEEVGAPLGGHAYKLEFSLPVSEQISKGTALTVVLLVRDNWTKKTLGPSNGIPLLNFSMGDPRAEKVALGANDRFQHRKELSGGLYLYENDKALPHAYIVHKIKQASDEQASLKMVANNSLDWSSTAVIESPPSTAMMDDHSSMAALTKPGGAGTGEFAKVVSSSSNSISVLCQSNSPGWLILTDTFFPGWVADIDGRQSNIYPANHMFRGVKVPSGRHVITFNYRPMSYEFGCTLFLITLGFSLCLLIRNFWQTGRFKVPRTGEGTDISDQIKFEAGSSVK